MTVADYIRGTFKEFGILISDANLLRILSGTAVTPDDEQDGLDKNQSRKVEIGIVRFIPMLLLRASSKSVSENGHSKSQSWDVQALKDFYSMQCKEYVLKDQLNLKPKITFL